MYPTPPFACWQGRVSQGSGEHATSSGLSTVTTGVQLDGDEFQALVDGCRMRGHYDSYMAPGDFVQTDFSHSRSSAFLKGHKLGLCRLW